MKKIANTGASVAKGGKALNSLDFDLDFGNEPGNSKGFLRVGDIVIILYDERVYDELHDVGKVAGQTKEGEQKLE